MSSSFVTVVLLHPQLISHFFCVSRHLVGGNILFSCKTTELLKDRFGSFLANIFWVVRQCTCHFAIGQKAEYSFLTSHLFLR